MSKEQTLVPSDTLQNSFFYGPESLSNNIFVNENVLSTKLNKNVENFFSFSKKTLPVTSEFQDTQNIIRYKKGKSFSKSKRNKFSTFLTIYRNQSIFENEDQNNMFKDPYLK